MRAAYLAQDRGDINVATKSLARSMQSPHEAALGRLKRLGKYLKKYPMVAREFVEQKTPDKLKTFVDTDHAGCAITRKSTTGPAMRFGQHCIKHSSNLQSTVSLPSGESAFYGLVKGSAAALGMHPVVADGLALASSSRGA